MTAAHCTTASFSSYFSVSKIDLVSLYQIVRGGALAAMTSQQSAGLLGAEAMAQGFLGMSVSEALQLFTGEFGDRIGVVDDIECLSLSESFDHLQRGGPYLFNLFPFHTAGTIEDE